ncbi:MAG: RluA family pseudouridine synthase [Bauldia litoralis]
MSEAVKIAAAPVESSITVTVGEGDGGARLDAWLAGAIDDLSRTRIKQLIKDGRVASSGAVQRDPAFAVRTGDAFEVSIPAAVPPEPAGQVIPLDVVFEDDDLICVNKSAGMVVHPAPGSMDQTLVNALIAHCGESLSGIGGVMRPGIVHRLDKDTSGLMIAAKNDRAHRHLARQFADHSIERVYRALVWGVPRPLNGTIEGNIGRHPTHRTKMAVVSDGGKHARTYYKMERSFANAVSLISCRLSTGRTHQIRVHMAHRGHPIVGDRVYGRQRNLPGRDRGQEAGDALQRFDRQALHAAVIGFEHPVTGETLRFEAELPKDMKELIDKLELL